MEINLNDTGQFTLDNIRKLIASEDDSVNTQFRVTKEGILFLSKIVGNNELDGILFRLETNGAYNGYVGLTAAKDDSWVERIYNVIKKNYPNPLSTYIDTF